MIIPNCLTNVAKVDYYSELDRQTYTIYSNKVKTDIINTCLCKCIDYCVNSCINLPQILCTPVCVVDIDTSASIVKYCIEIENCKKVLSLKIELIQNIYYKQNCCCDLDCYEYKKFVNFKSDLSEFDINSCSLNISSKCLDYTLNDSGKLMTDIVLNICN